MTRTAAIVFPITLFAVWWMYVVGRAGNGPGFRPERVTDHVYFVVAITGTLYLIFVAIALIVLYFTRVRGHPVTVASLLLPALLRFAAFYLIALAVGSTLGEVFCVVEERSFERDAKAFLATATPDPITHEMPMYSRQRWWPGSAQILIWPPAARK